MRILLTGVTGQVGGAIRSLLQHDELVRADLFAVTRQDFDLSRPETLAPVLDRLQPDVIINPAAYTAVDQAEDEPDLAYRANAEAPAAMARWAANRDVPFLHFSTDYVFSGHGDSRAWTEADPCAPLSVYGQSKRDGERLIAEANGLSLVIRTSWVYAATGKNFFRTMARLATERTELRVVADQFGAPTSARSIAQAVRTIVATGRTAMIASFADAEGVVHLTNSGATSWHGFAQAIVGGLSQEGLPIKAESVTPIATSDFPTKARRPANSRLDLSRLGRVFGIAPVDWRVALDIEIQDFIVTQRRPPP